MGTGDVTRTQPGQMIVIMSSSPRVSSPFRLLRSSCFISGAQSWQYDANACESRTHIKHRRAVGRSGQSACASPHAIRGGSGAHARGGGGAARTWLRLHERSLLHALPSDQRHGVCLQANIFTRADYRRPRMGAAGDSSSRQRAHHLSGRRPAAPQAIQQNSVETVACRWWAHTRPPRTAGAQVWAAAKQQQSKVSTEKMRWVGG